MDKIEKIAYVLIDCLLNTLYIVSIDSQIYSYMLKRCGVQPCSAIYVGRAWVYPRLGVRGALCLYVSFQLHNMIRWQGLKCRELPQNMLPLSLLVSCGTIIGEHWFSASMLISTWALTHYDVFKTHILAGRLKKEFDNPCLAKIALNWPFVY